MIANARQDRLYRYYRIEGGNHVDSLVDLTHGTCARCCPASEPPSTPLPPGSRTPARSRPRARPSRARPATAPPTRRCWIHVAALHELTRAACQAESAAFAVNGAVTVLVLSVLRRMNWFNDALPAALPCRPRPVLRHRLTSVHVIQGEGSTGSDSSSQDLPRCNPASTVGRRRLLRWWTQNMNSVTSSYLAKDRRVLLLSWSHERHLIKHSLRFGAIAWWRLPPAVR
jgi:hypothetical protein